MIAARRYAKTPLPHEEKCNARKVAGGNRYQGSERCIVIELTLACCPALLPYNLLERNVSFP
jgi:hypothetical protein